LPGNFYPFDLEAMPEIPRRLEIAGVIVMLVVALLIILSNTSGWLTRAGESLFPEETN